ncbi:hypothetical protein MaudMau93_003699 [Microsporum audouinii]
MSSTLVGRSGREYIQGKILKQHPKRPDLNVYLARSENQDFVLKRVSDSMFEQSLELKLEFPGAHHLRMHVDDNVTERVLVYKYLNDDLLSLVKHNPSMSLQARKWILQELGKSLKELHAKNWIHIDVKPDNVMVDYSWDKDGQLRPERVMLSDFDCSLKLKDKKLLRLPKGIKLGNTMWRSPEGQTGQGIGKASDVFSYGLVCLFTTTSVETLHPDFEQLRRDGIEPELEVMGRLISYFGPVPAELVAHIQDDDWGKVMMVISDSTMDGGPVGPGRFIGWKEKDYPNLDSEAKRMLLRIFNLDPAKRPTIEEILEDPWWNT